MAESSKENGSNVRNAQLPVTTDVQCDKHPNEKVFMYCEQCDVLVCHDCIGGTQHRRHCFLKISQILDQKKSELQDVIEGSNSKINICEMLQNKINQKQKNYDEKTRETTDRLKERCDELHSVIDAAFVEMNKRIEQKASKDRTSYTEISNSLNRKIVSIEEFVQKCNEKMSVRSLQLIRYLKEAGTTFDTSEQSHLVMTLPSPCHYKPRDASEQTIRSLLGKIVKRNRILDEDLPPDLPPPPPPPRMPNTLPHLSDPIGRKPPPPPPTPSSRCPIQ